MATGAWVLGPATILERALFGLGGLGGLGGLALIVTTPIAIGAGLAFMAVGLGLHLILRRRRGRDPAGAVA